MGDDTLRVLVVEPMKRPYVREVPHTLENMQALVGGDIEVVPILDAPGASIICNDEGKLLGLPYNRALHTEDGEVYDIVCGTFFVAGVGEESFKSLTDEQIRKYADKYSRERVIAVTKKLGKRQRER